MFKVPGTWSVVSEELICLLCLFLGFLCDRREDQGHLFSFCTNR